MVTIRPYEPRDCEGVADLWLLLHRESAPQLSDPDPELRDAFRKYLAGQTSAGILLTWVAEASGALVSTVSLVRYPIPERQGKAYEASVINVVTHPMWRRRGIATDLMRAVVEHVEHSPIRRAWLRTTSAAKGLYVNAGFSFDGSFMMYEPPVR
jgi:ribosomal protein S18 acetylase RimI-like enzyme